MVLRLNLPVRSHSGGCLNAIMECDNVLYSQICLAGGEIT